MSDINNDFTKVVSLEARRPLSEEMRLRAADSVKEMELAKEADVKALEQAGEENYEIEQRLADKDREALHASYIEEYGPEVAEGLMAIYMSPMPEEAPQTELERQHASYSIDMA